MGFLTRLLAGLLAASTLGTGLAGTANAVDVTGAAGTTKSVVKLTADGGNETSEDTADNPDDDSTDADSTTDAGAQSDAGQQAEIQSSTSRDKATTKSSLPDHIVNGSFDYPACPDGKNSCDVDPTTGWGGFYVDYGRKFMPIPDWNRSKFGWDSSQEGLRPDQQPNSHQKLQHCVQIGNKPNNNGQKMNRFAEIIAETPDEYIYQDIATTPGVMYRWSLKHASEDASHVDSMQVTIGSPGKETAQDATRTTSNGRGDRTGVTSKTIATKGGQAEWETYTGVYIATSTVTRFTFKSAQGRDSTRGNFIDDVMFTKAYKLTYDKNSADASGQVPSNQRGKENTTQPAKTKTNGKIRLASDTSKLSDHLINSDFEYLPDGGWKTINARYDMASAYTSVDPNNGQYIRNTRHADSDTGTAWVDWDGFDASKFAWRTDQKGGQDQGGLKDRANAVELQQDSTDGNTYAEMVASEAGRTIYQDLKTIPGTLYKIRLKHASLCKDNVDKMQVVINGTPIEMTRVTANGKAGDKVGEKSTTIGTRVTNENRWHHSDQWETYEGYYVIPDGQTTTRFGFKAVNYLDPTKGNLLDDVTFARAYKLSYDKNASDATGSVPSNQRGKENTVQPAASKTDGNVKTVSDDAAGRTVLECKQSGEGATGPYADKFCWIDWSNLPLSRTGEPIPVRINVPGGHIDADATITHTDTAALATKDFTGDKWSRLIPAYRLTGNTALAFHHIQGNSANPLASVMFSNITPVANQTAASVNVLKDFQLAFGDAETMSGYVVNDRKTYEQTDIESDKTLDKLGMIGDNNPNQSYSEANIGYGTTHVTLAGGPAGKHAPFTDDSNSKGAAVIGATQPTRFKVSFKQVNHPVNNAWSAIAVGVYMPYLTAYPLNYDKNSSNATGEVPSNQRGRENTVQPAKAKTTGTVKTVADGDSSKSLTVNPGFDVPDYSKLNDGGLHWMYVSPAEGKAWSYYDYINPAQPGHQVAGLSQATFGWQELTGGDHKTTSFELHREKDGNVCADVHGGRTIGQTIDTQAGVAYTVSIRHSGRSKGNAGSVQVLVGPDKDHLRPLEMSRMNVSRTGAKYGDRIGKVGTVVTTHSDSVDSTEGDHPAWDHSDDWETYSGTYVATGGKTVFAYRGVDKNGNADSVIDDLSFKLAYPLVYDKNAGDATGSVPSSQYGKENTVQPAKAKTKTTGTVRAVADRTASGLTVHDLKNGEIAPVQYGDFKFSTTDGFTADQVTDVNGFTVKTNSNPFWEALYTDGTSTAYFPTKNGASLVLHHVGQWRDSSGAQRWLNARITVNGQNLGFLYYETPTHHFNIGYGKWDKKPSSRPYMDVTVDFLLDDGSTPQGLRGVTGFTDLDGGTSGYNEGVELVSGFDGAYVRSDAHLARFGTNGWAGATDENAEVADEHGMKHYVGATFTGSSFRVRWSVASGQARGSGFQPVDSTIAYRLTYNKNAQDATGSIPSDTAANTTQPAKSETDGKVSDLVQRTTTHEDGSVTVKTIDTSTDVVSGCQVYYPAGQRITLATMAKDDDCWDSSMLSRPGHTQLGWNQDRNATQAQAQVTMVEGGMTVYAVWVGNPVLTYDTNKPSTWSGQMPSTPASVSVAYNTAAADGSGWRAGDTTKIRGYRFLGWYTGPQDNAGLYDWTRPLTGSVTVYAHWQRLQANVVYNANGGTGSHPNTTGWQYSDVTIPGDTSKSFKRDKYVFKGWGTKPGKADVVYKDGSKVALQDKDITLYAQWQEVHENFVETGGIGLPIAIAGGVLLLMFGIGSTVMLTRRMNGHGMPDDE